MGTWQFTPNSPAPLLAGGTGEDLQSQSVLPLPQGYSPTGKLRLFQLKMQVDTVLVVIPLGLSYASRG